MMNIESKLARFRPSDPPAGSPGPDPNSQVVRYQPPETRSQQDRLDRADAGDLHARLQLLSVSLAETVLARRPCPFDPNRSLLGYLTDPGDGVSRQQAAVTLLEGLAEKTESAALDSFYLYRLVQAYGLWRGHPDSQVQSEEDLVRSLAEGDCVQANIVIGSQVRAKKLNRIHAIDQVWGEGWFQQIPSDLRDSGWAGPEDCSHRLLKEIATYAGQGVLLDGAIDAWRRVVHDRTDFGRRRDCNIKGPAAQHLLLGDVAALNKANGHGKRDALLQAKDHLLRIEVVPADQAARDRGLDYSDGAPPRKKRRSRQVIEIGDDEAPADRIDRPVPETPPGSPPSSPPLISDIELLACRGPDVARALRALAEALEDDGPPDKAGLNLRHCDRCLARAQEVLRCVYDVLEPCAEELEGIRIHRFAKPRARSPEPNRS